MYNQITFSHLTHMVVALGAQHSAELYDELRRGALFAHLGLSASVTKKFARSIRDSVHVYIHTHIFDLLSIISPRCDAYLTILADKPYVQRATFSVGQSRHSCKGNLKSFPRF